MEAWGLTEWVGLSGHKYRRNPEKSGDAVKLLFKDIPQMLERLFDRQYDFKKSRSRYHPLSRQGIPQKINRSTKTEKDDIQE